MNIFNKKFWENYWYYYRIHTFAGVFILFLVLMTINDCANKVNYDMNAILVSPNYIDETTVNDATLYFEQYISDINDDGEIRLFILPMHFTPDVVNEQSIAMTQKIMLEFMNGDNRMYLMDEDTVLRYKDLFLPLDEYVDVSQEDALLVEGKMLAIKMSSPPLKDSTPLNDKGLYLGLRVLTEADSKDAKLVKMHDNALSILSGLIGN